MISFFKKNYRMLMVMVLTFLIYLPSLFVFYTNDDFFFLKISRADSLAQFIGFFDITKGPDGFGMYRPLSTQAFYFLAWEFFDLKPLGLHVISFITLFAVLHLITRLVTDLGGNKKTALIAAFLYGTSATHFGHMYYLATYQEILATLFVLLSCIGFIRQKFFGSLVFFGLALMSKETAVVTPLLLVLIYFYQKLSGRTSENFFRLMVRIFPFVLILAVYFGFRIFSYGFATGNTYIWDFSIRKLINSLAWYLAWSLNIPETFIDFIGPGLTVSPNLFKYWPSVTTAVFSLFAFELASIGFMLWKAISRTQDVKSEIFRVIVFCCFWFIISLLPVIFLPAHKFSYFLTLPLVGIAVGVAFIANRVKLNSFFIALILIAWLSLSIVAIRHSEATNWITNGAKTSKAVYNHFNNVNYGDSDKIVFVDTKDDLSLPWSPTQTVKVALSDKNFFKVFYPDLAGRISYSEGDGIQIESRQFLGY